MPLVSLFYFSSVHVIIPHVFETYNLFTVKCKIYDFLRIKFINFV